MALAVAVDECGLLIMEWTERDWVRHGLRGPALWRPRVHKRALIQHA
jgi:hypothetical protein